MKRIISLLPSATEIIAALDALDALVAVTHECDYPEAVRHKPRVTAARIDPSMSSEVIDGLVREQLDATGSLYTLDMELVASLAPQLVLTQQLCTVCAVGYATVHAAMSSLSPAPSVVNLEPRTLEEVFATIREVAGFLGIGERGDRLVERLRADLHAIPRIDPRPRALLLEWLIPPFAAGHWMPELVRAAGGEPVLHFQGTHSREVSWSAIADAEFDVLVLTCCGFSVERMMADVASSPDLARVLAERPGARLVAIDGNHFFSRPGPRLVESARLLNAALLGLAPVTVEASVPDAYRVYASEELEALITAGAGARQLKE